MLSLYARPKGNAGGKSRKNWFLRDSILRRAMTDQDWALLREKRVNGHEPYEGRPGAISGAMADRKVFSTAKLFRRAGV